MPAFIFNTTYSLEDDSFVEWKKWMNRNFLPTFKELIPSLRVEIYQVMAVVQEGSTNFSCQMRCNNPDELDTINKYAAILHDNLKASFGERCLFFSSILREEDMK